ncbi:MAG: ABC transporter ATP-binding protein [Paracoccaceae bacterium]
MIHFRNVSKFYRTRMGTQVVLRDASFDFDIGHNYGILGANGAGKSTLLRMISGGEPASSGKIYRRVRVSFPLGFSGTFNGYLTARQNATFMARVYKANIRKVLDFVWDFSELGPYFDMPINTYSSGMRAKFSLGLSFAIDFDVYLVDEVTEVGDAKFRAKSAQAFRERVKRSDVIMVTHNSNTIKAYCDRGAVLENGRIIFYPTIEEAIKVHSQNMSIANVEN